MKKCTKCDLFKDLNEFYIRNSKHISVCKGCIKSRVTKYTKTDDGRYVHAQAIAKFRDKNWDINKADYLNLLKKPCYYCNGILDDNGGAGLDRIENSLGYTLDNVIRCCSFCNYLRGDLLTVEETKILIDVLISLRYGNKQKAA